MTPRIDVEDATNKADLLVQEVRIVKLQAELDRLNGAPVIVSSDEYGVEFGKMSRLIKDYNTVMVGLRQTLEDQKTEITHQKQTIERLYKTIDELRKLVSSTGEDRDKWMDKSRCVNEIRAERDVLRRDSIILMGIVDIVRESNAWSSSQSMNDIADVLVDYLKEPEPHIDDGRVVVCISVEEEQHGR